MSTYTTTPEDEVEVDGPNAIELDDLKSILNALRIVRARGGWGRVVITLKGSEVNEIETTYTQKVK